MNSYQERIQAQLGCSKKVAAMVEGYMRLDWGTLDGLSADQFAATARACFHDVGKDQDVARRNAESFGLLERDQ